MAPKHNPQQEPLLITTASGQLMERDFSHEPGEYNPDPIARNIHLINVIDLMPAINELEGLGMKAQYPPGRLELQREYRKGTKHVLANANAKLEELRRASRWEFARAYGMFDRIDQGLQTVEEAQADTINAYNAFWAEYGNAVNGKKRVEYRKQLTDEVDALKLEETRHNRASRKRPHIARKKRSYVSEGMDSQERLQAIYDDPRAGFIPVTHKEKTTVMALLDYLDNPEYPIGVRHQPLEIARFHEKKARDPELGISREEGRERGVQAAWSKTYELGDHLVDATKQLEALRDLQLQLYQPILPHLSLANAVGADHPAYAALTRFRDLTELRIHGRLLRGNVPNSPLHPTRNETAPEVKEFDRKNKIVEDPYTRTDILPEFAERIAQLPYQFTVKDARALVTAAVMDSAKRAVFMQRVLEDYAATSQERVLGPAHKAARFILARFTTARTDVA